MCHPWEKEGAPSEPTAAGTAYAQSLQLFGSGNVDDHCEEGGKVVADQRGTPFLGAALLGAVLFEIFRLHFPSRNFASLILKDWRAKVLPLGGVQALATLCILIL